MVSKRRKVVVDMVSNVLAEFCRGLDKDADWAALGPSALGDALSFLEGLLELLTKEEPEYYNDDAQLGAAVNTAALSSSAIQGWGKGAAALATFSGHEMVELLELKVLVLERKLTNSKKVRDGIGTLLFFGKLRKLELKGAMLGRAGAVRLAVELGGSSLTSINLESNYIDTEGGKAIAAAISASSSMTSINLRSNRLGEEGGKAIAATISASSSMASINLGFNNIRVEGGKAIAAAISASSSMMSINLENNSIGDEGSKAITAAISATSSLTSIK